LSSQQCVGYVQLCWLDAFDWKFATGTNQCFAVISIFEEPSVLVFLIFQNRRIANPVFWVKKNQNQVTIDFRSFKNLKESVVFTEN
jgi:hypothetical protein